MESKKYVDFDKVITTYKTFGHLNLHNALEAFNEIPAADVMSRGAYDQTDWERCVALTQLKEIGKSLGERMDDVRLVVRGKWEDCTEYNGEYRCSVCKEFEGHKRNFCPNCGADMRGINE